MSLELSDDVVERLQTLAASRQQSTAELIEELLDRERTQSGSPSVLSISPPASTNASEPNSRSGNSYLGEFGTPTHEHTLLSGILQTSVAAIFVLDAAGQIVFANQPAEEILGLSRSEMMHRAYDAPEWQATALDGGPWPDENQPFRRVMESGEPVNDVRHAVRWPDGRRKLLSINGAPIRDDRQEIAHVVFTVQDITHDLQLQADLRRSEITFESVSRNAPGAIYLCKYDYVYNMIFLSAGIERLTGYSADDFIDGRINLRQLIHPEDGRTEMPRSPENDFLREESFFFRYRIRHSSGEWRWIEDHGGGVYDDDGQLLYLAGFMLDVTEKVVAEEALHESQRMITTLISNLTGAVFRCLVDEDNQMELEFISDGIEAISGYTAEEYLLGKEISLGTLVEPEDRERVWEEVHQALDQREPYRVSYQIHDRHGQRRWIAEHGQGVYSEEGALYALEGLITDITKQRQAEEALRNKQKTESLGLLAGGVAHDFNNLLVAMLGQTSLAMMKMDEADPAYRHIQRAVTAAEKAAELTQQMLAYSGRGRIPNRPVDLNQLILENLHLFRVAVPPHIELRTELAGDLPIIFADPGQMQQVLMNLILNGTEAIEDGPGTVLITTRFERITGPTAGREADFVSTELGAGNYAVLEVADSGKGIEHDVLPRIFDPFFSTKFTGRGLGLAAVLGIIGSHQGCLHVFSDPGHGTTFRIYYPLYQIRQPLPR